MSGTGTGSVVLTGLPITGGLVSAPTLEPITLDELKIHLRLDSNTFDGNLSIIQSMAYGGHAIADNYTTHVGDSVEVIGKQAEVLLHCGENGATGTVDTKIQESDDDSIWTDYANGAFTQVTTANDNTDYKKPYIGTKRYIRTVSKVLLASCDFGTSILVNEAGTSEDELLTIIIQAAREYIEDYTRRAIIMQTWDYCLQLWPLRYFKLPYGNLQSVLSFKWYDSDGDETILVDGVDYLVSTNAEKYGVIFLPSDISWPSGVLYPYNPIVIRFTCGWFGPDYVPARIKAAMKMVCADMYENRESQVIANIIQAYSPNKTVQNLLWNLILWDEL